MGKKILVIGSANVDFILKIPRFHEAGETIQGEDAVTAFGGKGANQAVAARRLGGAVDFLTALGDDAHGKAYRKYLVRSGFKEKFLLAEAKKPTGMALIEIVPNGENRIIVSPGANGALSPLRLKRAGQVWKGAGVLVAQLETPMETVRAALETAKRKGIPTILNPAPARPLSRKILSTVDYLVPNEMEAEEITGVKIRGERGLSKAASELLSRGAKNVVITLGEKGTYFKNRQEEIRVEAFRVKAVDTTAAGDAFVGTLAWGLEQGMDMEEVLIHANAAGALAATRLGAQPSLPTIAEVRKFLRKRRNKNRRKKRRGEGE
jgi:ribokinase